MHARTRLRLGVKMLKKADLRIKMQRRTSQKTRDDYFWKIFYLIIILTGPGNFLTPRRRGFTP